MHDFLNKLINVNYYIACHTKGTWAKFSDSTRKIKSGKCVKNTVSLSVSFFYCAVLKY